MTLKTAEVFAADRSNVLILMYFLFHVAGFLGTVYFQHIITYFANCPWLNISFSCRVDEHGLFKNAAKNKI